MSKALTTQNVSNIESDILEAENRIDSAMITEGETWVIYATELERIKADFDRATKKKEKPFGLNSFTAYCKSSRSRFKETQCGDYARALPDYRLAKTLATASEINWTEWTLREVRKLKTSVGKKQALKNAAKDHIDNGTPLGTAVKAAVADTRTIKSEINAIKKFKEETDPAANLKSLIRYTEKHLDAFEMLPNEFWKAAEKASPGIAATAAKVTGKLAAFLRRR